MQSDKKQALTQTSTLKTSTVVEMLTRTAAHYPQSKHTIATLEIVSEDWYSTFKDVLTDRAFVEAVTIARRNNEFFPKEKDIFDIIKGKGSGDCKECSYWNGGRCQNLRKEGFDSKDCGAFIHNTKHK